MAIPPRQKDLSRDRHLYSQVRGKATCYILICPQGVCTPGQLCCSLGSPSRPSSKTNMAPAPDRSMPEQVPVSHADLMRCLINALRFAACGVTTCPTSRQLAVPFLLNVATDTDHTSAITLYTCGSFNAHFRCGAAMRTFCTAAAISGHISQIQSYSAGRQSQAARQDNARGR